MDTGLPGEGEVDYAYQVNPSSKNTPLFESVAATSGGSPLWTSTLSTDPAGNITTDGASTYDYDLRNLLGSRQLPGVTWVPDTDPEDNLCDQPYEQHFLRWTGTSYSASDYAVYPPDGEKYLRIPLEADGTAKVRFKVSKCPGDNYALRGVLRLKTNPRDFQEPWLSASGTITGFERLFIEVDKAAKKGFYLKQDISPGPAPAGGVKVWVFHDFSKETPGDPIDPNDKVLAYLECDKSGSAPYTCCEAFASTCPSTQSKPYRPVFFVDGRPERRFDPAHPENSDMAYIRGVSCTIQQNTSQYFDFLFDNECVFELVSDWHDGSTPYVFAMDYDATGGQGGTTEGAGVLLADPIWDQGQLVGFDVPVDDVFEPPMAAQLLARTAKLFNSAFWDVQFIQSADILPAYPRSEVSLIDPYRALSEVYCDNCVSAPQYQHYGHLSPGTLTMGSDFKPRFLYGATSPCVTQGRSLVVFLDTTLDSVSQRSSPELLGTTVAHEAFHLFDLNVPHPTAAGQIVWTCPGGSSPPAVCTSASPPPWCGDHVDDVYGDIFPGDLTYPALMFGWLIDMGRLPQTVKGETSFFNGDTSGGAAYGQGQAATFALRHHEGIGGQ